MRIHPGDWWCVLAVVAGALAGCAGPRGDIRPMIAVDGDRMDIEDPVANGRALLVTGQYGLAIDALSGVLHDDPRNVRALNLIAEAYDRLHRYDLADRYHGEALEADPNSVAALNNWGFSYLVRGDKTRAIGLLQRAVAIKGDQPVVLANLRLATGGEAAASGTPPATPAADGASEIPLGEHVTLVRRTGTLVRVAPGIQLLVTRIPSPAPDVQVSDRAVAPGEVQIAPLSFLAQPEPAGADPRTRNLAALQRLLDPSPFGFFPEVDDFNLKRQAGTGPIALSGSILVSAEYRLAG
ncbi:MAG TPA: tetratricopeptide repeat protein [Dongiaceae bacterium]|nr:tetratricopeptide repeat protein [Dongiaceae bacterium]